MFGVEVVVESVGVGASGKPEGSRGVGRVGVFALVLHLLQYEQQSNIVYATIRGEYIIALDGRGLRFESDRVSGLVCVRGRSRC